MSIKCNKKKLQYVLATLFYGVFLLDSYLKFTEPIPVEYLYIYLIIIAGVYLWDEWMYEDFISDIKKPISKNVFQCILTYVLMASSMLMIASFMYFYFNGNYFINIP